MQLVELMLAGADQPYTGYMNTIQYYSVVTAGNAVNFGDLSTVHENITGTSDSPTRGIICFWSIRWFFT